MVSPGVVVAVLSGVVVAVSAGATVVATGRAEFFKRGVLSVASVESDEDEHELTTIAIARPMRRRRDFTRMMTPFVVVIRCLSLNVFRVNCIERFLCAPAPKFLRFPLAALRVNELAVNVAQIRLVLALGDGVH